MLPPLSRRPARVSFLIPTYNRCGMLPAAVASARAASADEVEIVIIDDASTDATPQVCAKLRASIPNVVVVRQPVNAGLAQARNAGIAASSGQYLALLDDDDLRLANSLDAQVEALNASPEAGFAYAPVKMANSQMKLTGDWQPRQCPQGELFWPLLMDNFIRVPSVVMRREALAKVGLFDGRLRRLEDWDRWIHLSAAFPVVSTEEPVAIYRQGDVLSQQLSSDYGAMARTGALWLEKWLQLPPAQVAPATQRDEVRSHFRAIQSSLLLNVAAQLIGCGRAAEARRDLAAVLELRPPLHQRQQAFRLWLRSWLPVPPRMRREPEQAQ